MRVLIAGATGALGRQILPRLLTAGHDVTAMIRTPEARNAVSVAGATAVYADALDPEAVARAVAGSHPEVIVHELTALPGALNMRRFDRDFAATNRLRTEATDHLLAAGRAVDVQRFVAQSFAGWPFARVGGPVKTEEDPLDSAPAAGMRATLAALRHLEDAVLGADWTEGVVLRYGNLYGPGTAFEPGHGAHAELIRKRRLPVVGAGTGVWSFVDVCDAADATVSAVSKAPRGIYNIVDDDPAPVAEWLPTVARTLGAASPRRVPRWLARVIAGEPALVAMTEARGASNAKAKRELGWQPAYASWRGRLGREEDR